MTDLKRTMDGDCGYDFDLLERYTFFWITYISIEEFVIRTREQNLRI